MVEKSVEEIVKEGKAVVDVAPVRNELKLPKRVKVFDTTLRDGEQTPGITVTPGQKKEVALALDALGVDIIEAGFPVSSEGERQLFRELSQYKLNAKLCGLARCEQKDMDAVMDNGANYVHIFLATSPIHMTYKLKMTPEQVLEKAVASVEYVKSRGFECEFSPEDASRSDLEFLKKVCLAVEDAGADVINVPDTVGASVPRMMFRLISELKKEVKIPLSVHCHDDFGLAVANTLAAVEAGAEQVQCTINGVGERAGNASLEETIMALKVIYGVESNVRAEKLYETSQFWSRTAKFYPSPNKAIVGENAFSHEAGVHVHGVLAQALTYEPIDPKMVGQKTKIVYGKLTGKHAVKARLEELGFKPSEEQLEEVTAKVKHLGDLGKRVRDFELRAIAEDVFGIKKKPKAVLEEFSVVTGLSGLPAASLKMRVNGKVHSADKVEGKGTVDASLNAIQKALTNVKTASLKEYKLDAITGGSDALCEVTVVMETDDGKEAVGRDVGIDIVMTSVNAMMDAVNGILA